MPFRDDNLFNHLVERAASKEWYIIVTYGDEASNILIEAITSTYYSQHDTSTEREKNLESFKTPDNVIITVAKKDRMSREQLFVTLSAFKIIKTDEHGKLWMDMNDIIAIPSGNANTESFIIWCYTTIMNFCLKNLVNYEWYYHGKKDKVIGPQCTWRHTPQAHIENKHNEICNNPMAKMLAGFQPNGMPFITTLWNAS